MQEVVLVSMGPDVLTAIANYAGFFAGLILGSFAGLGLVSSWGW